MATNERQKDMSEKAAHLDNLQEKYSNFFLDQVLLNEQYWMRTVCFLSRKTFRAPIRAQFFFHFSDRPFLSDLLIVCVFPFFAVASLCARHLFRTSRVGPARVVFAAYDL